MNLPYLLAHLIGDFLLQTDWIAANKKLSHKVCTAHVALYMLPFLLCGLSPVQLVIIAVQHWLQDRYGIVRWYCRTLGIFQSESKKWMRLPWGHYIVDQIFHIVWMWAVVNFM